MNKPIQERAESVATQHKRRREAVADHERESFALMRDVLTWVWPAFDALATRGAVDLGDGLTWRRRGNDDELLTEQGPVVKGLNAMAAALAAHDVVKVIARLSDLLDQQLNGNSEKRTEETTLRADRLRAVRTLLVR